MSTNVLPSRIRDYFFAERGFVPGLASWRRRFTYPMRVA